MLQTDDDEGETLKVCEQPHMEEHHVPPQLAPPTSNLIQEQQAEDASDEHSISSLSSRSRTPCSVRQGAVSDDGEAVDDNSESEASDDTPISNYTTSGWASRKEAKVPMSMWGRHLLAPISPVGELANLPRFDYDSELEVEGEATLVYYWQPEHPDSQENKHASEDEVVVHPARILEAPDPQVLRSGRVVQRVL